jgi:WD40 repeat protein
MRDALEERLATHLRTLGDTVDDEFPPPVDLERQVLRHRRNTQAKRRWSSFGVAAAIVAAATTVAVVRGTTGGGSIRIATSPTTRVPVRDSLQPGTVMLSARGRYVVSLDATGHTNATMVEAQHGDIKYARATDDHRALWYLSLKKGSDACGDVVRADIEGRTSTIVTHAVAFDVSPDGSRLALYGSGDLAHDRCSPVKNGSDGRIVVLDLTSSANSALNVANVTSLRWSPDGTYLVSVTCSPGRCDGYNVIDVPSTPGEPLTVEPGAPGGYPAQLAHPASAVFGPHDLYTLGKEPTARIERIDPRAARAPVLVFAGSDTWDVTQVVPTTDATYVVAARVKSASWGLYRIDAGRLVFVRHLDSPGTFTPVTPLAATG